MIKTVKTLLAAALLTVPAALTVASAQTLDTTPTAQLYINNTSDITSPVNIYLDGQLFASNVFSGSPSTFAKSVTAGSHQVVVTPNYLAPGVKDILNTTITVPAGGSVLTLANTVDTTDGVNLQTGYELDFSNVGE